MLQGLRLQVESQIKNFDLSGGTWKNETAYKRTVEWYFYKLNDFIEGVDLSQYTTMNVTTEVYDKNGNILSDTSTGFVGFKLANKNGDWSGFADAYENRTGELSLAGYEGGDLYLVVTEYAGVSWLY